MVPRQVRVTVPTCPQSSTPRGRWGPPRGLVGGPLRVVLPRHGPHVALSDCPLSTHPRPHRLHGFRDDRDEQRRRAGKGIGEHRLGDYSKWLQEYVINEKNWEEIKSCLVGVKLCGVIESGKGQDYYQHKMSPILSGCCKPPNYCGFQFQNATYWTVPKTGPAEPEPDCKTWSNVQTELCFDCESCKVAILRNIKREWRALAIVNVCILAVVIMVYSIGCCALRNNRY